MRVAAALHCALYRSTAGSVGATIRGRPVLLLTTVGRKSGRARTSPVCFLRAGRGLVVAAAAGGLSRHPAWYLNLLAHPQVAVQLGSMRQRMVARVASGVERALLWDRFCLHYPVCADYAEKSGRVIPVVVLCSAPGRLGERPVSP